MTLGTLFPLRLDGSRSLGLRGLLGRMGGQPGPQVQGQLIGIELLGAAPEQTTPQRLQLGGQLADPAIFFLQR